MISSAPYKLRSYDPLKKEDALSMNLMFYHPEVMKAKGYFKEDFDFSSIADLHEVDLDLAKLDSKVTKKSHNLMYGVADVQDRLVGWIWFYKDLSHPLPRRVMSEYGLTPYNSRVFQISYQKLMSSGWPDGILAKLNPATILHLHMSRKGVIVEGLKMALKKLKAGFGKIYKIRPKIVIYGFISPDNIGSAKVLDYNGFKKYIKQYKYCGELNDLWLKII